jgi:sulfate/thiosulfate transport system substrate-binding protein
VIKGHRSRSFAGMGLALTMTALLAGSSLAQDATTPPTPTPFLTEPGSVTVVGYSTPREAYAQAIEAFQGSDAGRDIQFETSFGASGDQSRAVAAGLLADYVAFSLETDMTRLVDAGIVAPDWNTGPTKGMVTDSVVTFVVRPGNPKGIKTWDDLVRPDVTVVTPNPSTSGGARWNILAGYGAKLLKEGKTEEEAIAYLRDLFGHIVVQDKSARDALQTFLMGQGDVLLSYENEAITAQLAQQPIEYVVPDATILIENPAAVTLNGDAAVPAKAFLDYVLSPDGQAIFGNLGYRPVDPAVLATFPDFPAPTGLFTIADLGGWAAVAEKFFDKDTGIVTQINSEQP